MKVWNDPLSLVCVLAAFLLKGGKPFCAESGPSVFLRIGRLAYVVGGQIQSNLRNLWRSSGLARDGEKFITDESGDAILSTVDDL